LKSGAIGKEYKTGDVIVCEGDQGDCMYVIQEGTAEVIQTVNHRNINVGYLNEGDIFGVTAMFEKGLRPVSVRAMGKVRVLSIEKKIFLSRIHEDSSFAFNIIKKLSHRISILHKEYSEMKANDRRNWDTRPKKFKRKKTEEK
jgi:CRP-like cAMP-binding protein